MEVLVKKMEDLIIEVNGQEGFRVVTDWKQHHSIVVGFTNVH
jgi:hypothetical protein